MVARSVLDAQDCTFLDNFNGPHGLRLLFAQGILFTPFSKAGDVIYATEYHLRHGIFCWIDVLQSSGRV